MKQLAMSFAMGLAFAVPVFAQQEPSMSSAELGMTPNIASVQTGGVAPMLRVGIEQNALGGSANEEAAFAGSAESATAANAANAANARNPLTGTVQDQQAPSQPMRLSAQENADPDGNSPEMMLAWDKWRNHFAHAVWQRYCQTLDGPGTMMLGSIPVKLVNTPSYQFPQGLCATYACGVTSDHRIAYARLTASSGDRQLDAIILDCVMSMNGKKALAFPKGSARQFVMEHESLSTGTTGWHGRAYGDVERISQGQ